MTSNLPPEIITDVLSRLPVKSLLRFRCVSKSWCSLIDSRDFIKMQLNQSIKTNSNLSLILGFLGIYSVELDSLDSAKPLKPPFSGSDVLNSCNGLILVLAKNPFIWNPYTRKYRELPAAPIDYPGEYEVRSAYETYGFAYNSETDDYIVVRVVEFRGFDLGWINSEAKVYSLKSNTWRKINDFPYQLPYKRVWGVHLNGVLHTIMKTGSVFNPQQSIMAFNTRNERHDMVPKPDIEDKDVDFKVEVLGGCLCLIHARRQYRTDIWVMKEYRVKESWAKLVTVAPPLVEPYDTLCPLSYSKDGTELLLNHDDKRLIWYDLRRKTVRDVLVNGLPFIFYAEVCVGSLVRVGDFDDEEDVKEQSRNQKLKEKRDYFLSEGFKLVL